MIYLYPANKMESLLAIFNKIQQVSPLPFFTQETLIVQNAGMQHWLNMSIAQSRGISMNINYALPAQFLWKLLKSIASKESAPEQSPYSREVLTWRIYHVLAQEMVINDLDFSDVNHYWQRESHQEQGEFKRYQLAQKLADLYEQYLIFRPEWINAWCHQNYHFSSSSPDKNITMNTEVISCAKWQGKLWYALHQQLPYNPVELMTQAMSHIAEHAHLLPKRISLFAINAMAPMWLKFLEVVGQHTEVHFFHLNPCFDYWGDLLTEKAAISRLNKWTQDVDLSSMNYDENLNVSQEVGNPLLANLGQQGREFIALLQSVSTIDIEAYERVVPSQDEQQKTSVLHALQQDILTLEDRRTKAVEHIDESIVVSSCHSPLREVQALHDWLLHQFNNDRTLTPKDVLVMCPQIEDYAPYVNAVFARGWQDIDEGIPPLPCSIADRSSKDSDPIVAAFMELLSLPDSRFQVTHIYALLKLPAIQEKLAMCPDEVDQIATWLDHASIHWGLDAEHKNVQLNDDKLNSQFTWQQGLSRLLKGYAYSDEVSIVSDELLLPHVEGQQGVLLGKLMLFIEQLQQYLILLSKTRTPMQWQILLSDMLEQSFTITNEQSINVIQKAIAALGEYTVHADFSEPLSLTIVKDFLSSHFSTPDTSRQFMVGQVTFCSMLPMRSIPFKVIAVLGLNDGQFPRQRQPLAFDLMANTPPMLGDRSRRGDDRYLFLEAIISARQSLYLSYQGRSIKNNTPRQPSIVLNELFDYLTQGYGWDFSEGQGSQLRQTPMQPFSHKNYQLLNKEDLTADNAQNRYPSFDKKWLQLTLSIEKSSDNALVNAPDKQITQLTTAELIRFYQHPSKWYAQQCLNLYFDHFDVTLTDDEPFVADGLAAYKIREAFIDAYVNEEDHEQRIDAIVTSAMLSGKYADTPLTLPSIEQWRDDSEQFADQIKALISGPIINESFSTKLLQPIIGEVELSTQLPVSGTSIVCFRSSTPKHKDFFVLYLHQLLLQLAHANNQLTNVQSVFGFYFNTKSQKVVKYTVKPIENASAKVNQLTETFIAGQQAPLLVNGDLANKILTAKAFEQDDLLSYWQGDRNTPGFSADPYIQYFWPECVKLDEHLPILNTLFQPMYDAIEGVK